MAIPEFSDAELDEIVLKFMQADTDSDGSLDFVEFSEVLKNSIKVPDQLAALFKAFDKSGDGKVDFKEFASGLLIKSKGNQEQKLKFLFGLYDKDKNNILTKDEIAVLVKQLKNAALNVSVDDDDSGAEHFAQSLVEKLDFNKDGKITLDEWVTVGAKTPALLNLLS